MQTYIMSIFNIGKVCLFSRVQATLTRNGEPLKQVKIIRRWEWETQEEDYTWTNENGVFCFPAVFKKSLVRLLPIELVIGQGLYVEIQGEEIELWSNSKRKAGVNQEFNGIPIQLMCDLNNEQKTYREFGSIMTTLCNWST